MGEKAKIVVDIKDRKCKDKTFNASFIGREYCKWFIVNGVSLHEKGRCWYIATISAYILWTEIHSYDLCIVRQERCRSSEDRAESDGSWCDSSCYTRAKVY